MSSFRKKRVDSATFIEGANANRLHTCNMVLCNIDEFHTQHLHCFFLSNNSRRALATEYFGTGVSLLVNLSVERGVMANGTDSYTQWTLSFYVLSYSLA